MRWKKKRIGVHYQQGMTMLDLGTAQIWDYSDVVLLRTTLLQLFRLDGCRTVGIDMRSVEYIPPGFFGMLSDCHERGMAIHLSAPQPHIQKMLWFQQFCEPAPHGLYRLCGEPRRELSLVAPEIAEPHLALLPWG